jgi:hypothetical protein
MNIDKALKLFEEFKRMPKHTFEPTFLEVCRYPKRRFEEICSRILSFYFNPTKEHNLRDLFLRSLFELLNRTDIRYQDEQIKIVTEDNADGKRIDLLIQCPDFVIGIENKITASLYNPLEIYKKRIEEYKIENAIKLVLSLEKITKKEEIERINNNGFVAVTYSDFFETVKRNIGQYISSCNQKYLTHLFDFIQTIENMKSQNPLDRKLEEFFFDNTNELEQLINLYNSHKERILNIQKATISDLKEQISVLTGVKWWAWQDWDLGYNSFNQDKPRIGIESSFKAGKHDALAEFRIYITTWSLKDWLPYEKILATKFPDKFLDKVNNRVYLHVDVIDGGNEELILQKLKEYYDLLSEVTK